MLPGAQVGAWLAWPLVGPLHAVTEVSVGMVFADVQVQIAGRPVTPLGLPSLQALAGLELRVL